MAKAPANSAARRVSKKVRKNIADGIAHVHASFTMVQPCIDAIDAYNDGYDTNKLIELPDGIKWRGETHAPAWAIIEAHHLEAWLVHAWDCDCYDCMESEEQL